MYDIIYISHNYAGVKQFRERFPLTKYAKNLSEAKHKAFTDMFWVVWDDIVILNDFRFDYEVPEWDKQYVHVFKNNNSYDGVCLIPKSISVSDKEMKHRFFVNKKEIEIVASKPKLYDIFTINSYDEYLDAIENSTTEMFWMTSRNIQPIDEFKFDLYFPYDNVYDRKHNHAFIHRENGEESYDGIFLLSKSVPLSKREIEFRFPVDRKEWNVLASVAKPYDIFTVDTYDDYLNALEKSTTEMFWLIPKEVIPLDEFKFDLHFSNNNVYDRSCNHMFKNLFNSREEYNGIMLLSKHLPVSQREIDYRFIAEKKEHDIVASYHRLYDIVFISYNELNADDHYNKLKLRFPNAKRVHGVKGIHQAHIEAAKLVDTDMFWVVDGDAIINDDFNFEFSVSGYERDMVFTWKSKNPINDLVYGYGGVKLLPTKLTLRMDVTTTDMTTAISNKFRAVEQISNITSFNTDPFNTWKSAFRECVKLASKSIRGQVDSETEERLNIWCTVAKGDFAIHAIRGANAGRIYGKENAGNLPALSKINDFEWLEQQFKLTSVLR